MDDDKDKNIAELVDKIPEINDRNEENDDVPEGQVISQGEPITLGEKPSSDSAIKDRDK